MSDAETSRREFLELLGRGVVSSAALSIFGCASPSSVPAPTIASNPPHPEIQPLGAVKSDDLVLAEGFRYHSIARTNDILNDRSDRFGFEARGVTFVPLADATSGEGLLWVSHGTVARGTKRSREQAEKEMLEVGGSVIHVRETDGRWKMVQNSKYNSRLNAQTPIPFTGDQLVSGGKIALGTVGNGTSTITPWKTVLVCEEDYQSFYGEAHFAGKKRTVQRSGANDLGWGKFFPRPPEHYGWIVEVDLRNGKSKKLTALGRLSRSSIAVSKNETGHSVVYMLENSNTPHLLKFVAAEKNSLLAGTLFVANFRTNKWIELSIENNAKLSRAFSSQTEVGIRLAEAAKLAEGSPVDAKAIALDSSGRLVLSQSSTHSNKYGGLLRLLEKESGEFATQVDVTAANEVSCPGSMTTDPRGNLWISTSIPQPGKSPYDDLGNNSLFLIPAGESMKPLKIGSVPGAGLFSKPSFSADGKALFLTIRNSTNPAAGNLIAITGSSLDGFSAV